MGGWGRKRKSVAVPVRWSVGESWRELFHALLRFLLASAAMQLVGILLGVRSTVDRSD
jgi:hypothetical protein